MCLHTVYVHGCGHFATGPILTNPCLWDCDPITDVETFRRDHGFPYRVRLGVQATYIDIDSDCLDCMFLPTDPYVDIEVPGAENLVWHVPYVSCDESVFRPFDFGPARVKHQTHEEQVSQQAAEVSNLFEGSSDPAIDDYSMFPPLTSLFDNPSTTSYVRVRPTLSHAPAPSSRYQVKARQERFHPYSRTTRETRPPYAPNNLISTPLLPAITLVNARKLDKMSHYITRELDHAVNENLNGLAPVEMSFHQPIWNEYSYLTSFNYPLHHAYLKPAPLNLTSNINQPCYAQSMDWTYTSSSSSSSSAECSLEDTTHHTCLADELAEVYDEIDYHLSNQSPDSVNDADDECSADENVEGEEDGEFEISSESEQSIYFNAGSV